MTSNPLTEKMLNENPLIKFSVYTDIQSKLVNSLGQDILQVLQTAIIPAPAEGQGAHCDAQILNAVYGQFWLWVLGAYEVVRTMCSAKKCFSPLIVGRLMDLKRKLSILRMPFAKQELPGKSTPVRAEPSIYDIRCSPPDLSFEVKGQVLSARELIDEFAFVFSGISRFDILADQRTAYCSLPPA